MELLNYMLIDNKTMERLIIFCRLMAFYLIMKVLEEAKLLQKIVSAFCKIKEKKKKIIFRKY